VAVATSGAFLALLGARCLGAFVPKAQLIVCAAVAAPIALAAGVQRIVYLWRGPPIVSFSRIEAVRCSAAEAEAIRAAAQLRGTLGGAGHLHRSRLVLHALASLAAGSLAGFALLSPKSDAGGTWSFAVVAGTGVLAVLLPARPFYYREATNGDVLVSPPFARTLLVPARSRVSDPNDDALAAGRSDIAGRGGTDAG
jgi:hypothetical protein